MAQNHQERFKIGNRIILITIILNVLLTIMKMGIGVIGNSTAIIADGLHSASDIITSVGVVLGMFLAARPEDDQHQYGHEKAESIAGFLLAIVLVITGLKIGYDAIKLLAGRNFQTPHILTALVAAISIIMKEYQYRITMKAAKALNSNAMMGDAWHHRSDALSSVAALVGILGARLGYGFLDPLAGTIVSLIVVKIGLELLKSGIDELMDSAIDREKMEEIQKEINCLEGIIAINELRGRKHGSKAYVDIKICVDPLISVYAGHNIGEKVEELVKSKMNNVKDVIVHLDPCGRDSEYGGCTLNCGKNS
ncbi:cation diffusion facilitator family transporter [Anaerosolibacter carboniphilus]|uniref:Cation diffusion facilitator family transporter n=1 Tax=Anaerosolibacter carboniphilus TaxID=1417629 RepID=A0A841L415_9FIRM|nr:cation diffusion facilitator family transporter [Anaerosolibacter carboniphilus]MBB6217129.1 cation diffusion facilitator family transporter [Anaerosolibacter carboniphilus]